MSKMVEVFADLSALYQVLMQTLRYAFAVLFDAFRGHSRAFSSSQVGRQLAKRVWTVCMMLSPFSRLPCRAVHLKSEQT